MKQVRFDTLKPGECFDSSLKAGEVLFVLDQDEGHQAVYVIGEYPGLLAYFGPAEMVTPRPDITEGIKKLVGGSDES